MRVVLGSLWGKEEEVKVEVEVEGGKTWERALYRKTPREVPSPSSLTPE